MSHLRTRTRSLAVALAAGLLAAPLSAQTVAPACANQGELQDGCQKAADVFAFVAPQVAAALTGGNAVLGQSSTLGGLGHFAITLRATGLRGELPSFDNVMVGRGAATSDEFAVDEQWFAVPQVDVALGVFAGFPIGLTNIGGLDLLLGGSYVPEVDEDGFALSAPDGQLKLNYGARLGLVEETFSVPGVSVSYMRRELPTLDVVAVADDDSLSVTDARVRVDSWRAVVGKRFLVASLAAGIGQDRYDSEAAVSAVVRDGLLFRQQVSTAEPFSQEITRTNLFANLSLNFLALRLVGEIGRSWGGEAPTFNTFAGTSADASRLYGSVGLQLGR